MVRNIEDDIKARLKQQPDPQVVVRLDRQPAGIAWISGVTPFVAHHGLALRAAGRSRDVLRRSFDRLLQDELRRRVLPFDADPSAEATDLPAAT